MRTLPVTAASAAYPVHVGPGLLVGLAAQLQALLGPTLPRLFVLTSPPVWQLWGEAFGRSFAALPTLLFLPVGEPYKRLGEVERLLGELHAAGADRSSVLLAFGGGIVGDVGGFLAAIYMRGIPYVQVPTTLLAQVDSSVGGKTGVNLLSGKNLVGAFHHPVAVFADIDVLGTLPPRELRAGLVESLKAGLLGDAELFAWLETTPPVQLAADPFLLEQVVARSVEIKARIVAADERESGTRMLLNLGHTVGHAIEAVTGYGAVLHGEAVAWGLLAATHLARGRHLLTSQEAQRIEQAVRFLGPLPGFEASAAQLLQASAGDKKNRGGVRRFVLPRGIGDALVVEDVREDELLRAIDAMLEEVPARA